MSAKQGVNKTLAFVLAHTQKKLEEQHDEISREFKAILTEAVESASEELRSEFERVTHYIGETFAIDDQIKGSLREQTTLLREDMSRNLNSAIEMWEKNLSVQSQTTEEKFSSALESLGRDVQQITASLDVAFESISNNEMSSQERVEDISQAIGEHRVDTLSAVDSLSDKLREREDCIEQKINADARRAALMYQSVIDSIDDVSSKFDSRIKTLFRRITQESADLNSEIKNVEDRIETNLSKEMKSITRVLERNKTAIAKSIDRAAAKAQRDREKLNRVIEKSVQRVSERIVSTNESLKVVKGDVRSQQKQLDKTQKSIDSLASEIAKHTSDINAKLANAATKEELSEAQKRAREHAQELFDKLPPILEGAKGKDAKQWIFQFNPNVRGLLMYRREDWTYWRMQNLLGPTNESGDNLDGPAARTFFAGGGGNSTGQSESKVFQTIDEESRSFDSSFTISTTRDTFVTYSIKFTPIITDLEPTQTGRVDLQISSDGMGPWQTISTRNNDITGTMLFNSSFSFGTTSPICGWIPRGYVVRLVSSGSLIPSLISGQEVFV